MIHTFKGLRDQVLRILDEADDTGSTLSLVKDFMNQANQRRCMEYPWPFMLMDDSFSTTNGTQLYPLHQEFARPYYFFNQTKKGYLVEVPSRQVESDGYRWNEDENGLHFTLWGRTPVKYQPSSASVVTIASSSASDTGSTYNVIVKGEDSNGVIKAEILTPSGTGSVSSSTSFRKILGVTKAIEWNGTLTMTSNSAAVTNLTLDPSEMGRSYQQLFLLSDPRTGDVIEYRFFRQPLVLVNDYDIPEIPPPHSQILVWDTLLLFSAYNTDVRPASVAAWRAEQARLEDNIIRSFDEAQSLGANPRYVRYISEDAPTPRIYR